MAEPPEPWMRGPIEGLSPLVSPILYAFQQAREDLAKFTEGEALTILPWVANSPFLSWLYAVTSVQGGSNLIGVIELIIGVLLAVRPWWPRLSVMFLGSAGRCFSVPA